ncbi:MAG: dephospho-CoA kinase [Microbacteriaceae bacterium]|jgi:dephospho-CoA kinase|nr:dephospho-CoA kinase [Microbacteriaceae bacterium]MCI1206734.1 dephospho-CoA kinase [Microbacteriaceae bacterium]
MAYLVALTGGIGAGKSTVASVWRTLGAEIVDADQLAREVVSPGAPALAEVVRAFGPEILLPDGALDRPALAAIVFADPDRRRLLESILHPAVQHLAATRLSASQARIAVYDVPLLAEARKALHFDRIVVVSAPEEVRLRRLIEIRGMDAAKARDRIRSQATEAERLALADDVLDASGTLESTRERARLLWSELLKRAGASERDSA